MGSFSVWHWVIVLLIVLLVAGTSATAKPSLVIKKFFINSSPRDDGVYVEIIARKSGFWGWFFALLKIDSNYSLRILYDKVHYEASSVFGFSKVIMPIHSVSSVSFGTVRPWKLALFWFFLFAAGAYAAAHLEEMQWALGLTVSGVVIAILLFILNRELTIGVKEVTDTSYDMTLKRSIIEGQEISEAKLEEITQIFTAILDAHKAHS